MNDLPVAPVPERRPNTVLQTWTAALTRPSEQTYAEIASTPGAKASTAFLWVFLAALIQLFLAALVQGRLYPGLAQQFGLNPDTLGGRGGVGAILTGAICGAPIGAVIQTIFFAIWVAIVQWLARMFGGRGTYDQMAYTMAAIAAPYSLITGLLTLFSAIPAVGICFGLFALLAGLYVIALNLLAIKGVNQVGWGAALGALFIPLLVIGFICACLVGVSFAALMPLIRQSVPNLNP
ncbi:MAG: YIP1 family protein [Syntrophothermus sp.]